MDRFEAGAPGDAYGPNGFLAARARDEVAREFKEHPTVDTAVRIAAEWVSQTEGIDDGYFDPEDLFRDALALHRVVHDLNRRGIPSPSAGRRGTGSWAPGAIHEILRRKRYRGVYVHGTTDRIKRGGKRVARKADQSQVLRVEVPEWRIVDDVTWYAVQRDVKDRARRMTPAVRRAKHALAGVGTCAACGGGVVARNTKTSAGRAKGYACSWHHFRGASVCSVTVCQPVDVVEGYLTDHLRTAVLTEKLVEQIITDVRAEVEREVNTTPSDTGPMEAELRNLEAEKARLVKVAAQVDDDPDIIDQLNTRRRRIAQIQAELAAAKQTPAVRRDMLAKVERIAREKLADLRNALAGDREGMRDVVRAMFPEGLRFHADEANGRKVWRIVGTATVSPFITECDPTGN